MDSGEINIGLAGRVAGLLRRGLVQNVLALYSVQFVTYMLPLITVPYLTRVLGVANFGLYAIFQSFGLYAQTIVEYSFILSGTRDISRSRDDGNMRSDLLAGVIGAKLLLAGMVILACLGLQFVVPSFKDHPLIFWMGVSWGISLGFSLLWYFQGMERMRTAAALDLSAKTMATVAIFLLIKTPQDTWKIFLLYTVSNLTSVCVAAFLVYRRVTFRLPKWSLTRAALKTGWHVFTARLVVNVFAVGNNFILGLFAPATVVGYYASADKIGKTSAMLGEPVTYALFPRLALIVHDNPARAIQLMRRSLTLMLSFGAVLGLVLFLGAPIIIPVICGPGYEAAIAILRVMSPLPVILAASSVLGIQWMLSLRLDRQLNAVIVVTTCFNLILVLLLAPRFGGVGMAWSVVFSKIMEVAGFSYVLARFKVHPLNLTATSVQNLMARRLADAG